MCLVFKELFLLSFDCGGKIKFKYRSNSRSIEAKLKRGQSQKLYKNRNYFKLKNTCT
jgi:hypothetical protein